MREHMGLFRGKRTDNGEWIVGNLVHSNRMRTGERMLEIWVPMPEGEIDPNKALYGEVDPSTVGECTGLTDKNGRLIFEGDIVEGGDFTHEDGLGEIMYDTESARFQIVGGEPNNLCADFDNYYGRELEVMGNLWDNPELIGGTNNT